MALSLFTLSCRHHHHPFQNSFPCAKLKLCPHETLTPPSPLPWPRHPFFFLTRDLRILGISCKWSYTICVFLCLASFTEHGGLKVHPCCSLCQSLLPFYDWIRFHCVDGPHLVYPFIHAWALDLFPPLWIRLLWTRVCKYLFKTLLSVPLDKYQKWNCWIVR